MNRIVMVGGLAGALLASGCAFDNESAGQGLSSGAVQDAYDSAARKRPSLPFVDTNHNGKFDGSDFDLLPVLPRKNGRIAGSYSTPYSVVIPKSPYKCKGGACFSKSYPAFEVFGDLTLDVGGDLLIHGGIECDSGSTCSGNNCSNICELNFSADGDIDFSKDAVLYSRYSWVSMSRYPSFSFRAGGNIVANKSEFILQPREGDASISFEAGGNIDLGGSDVYVSSNLYSNGTASLLVTAGGDVKLGSGELTAGAHTDADVLIAAGGEADVAKAYLGAWGRGDAIVEVDAEDSIHAKKLGLSAYSSRNGNQVTNTLRSNSGDIELKNADVWAGSLDIETCHSASGCDGFTPLLEVKSFAAPTGESLCVDGYSLAEVENYEDIDIISSKKTTKISCY